jgi:hypothetical protein
MLLDFHLPFPPSLSLSSWRGRGEVVPREVVYWESRPFRQFVLKEDDLALRGYLFVMLVIVALEDDR